MEIRFWGVRGSLATPLLNSEIQNKTETILKHWVKSGNKSSDKIPDFLDNLPWNLRCTAGGDTTCVQVNIDGRTIIFDAGTGIRPLGLHLINRTRSKPIVAHLLMSHTHWDHVCGLPFFMPAYNPKNDITIYGVHENLKGRFESQQNFDFFPVPFSVLGGIKNIIQLNEQESFNIGDIEIQTIRLNHPGNSFGYRVTHDNKVFVFATDSEYKKLSSGKVKKYIEFFRDADVLVFDAQYTLIENMEKENWGHSNAFYGIDMALEAGVKRLVLTHHEPTYNDERLQAIFAKANEYLDIHYHLFKIDLELILAREGLHIQL